MSDHAVRPAASGEPEFTSQPIRRIGILRLAAGAAQGLALYLLYLSSDAKSWPSTDPYWIAPLLMVAVFVPLLFIQMIGNARWRTLALWTGGAAVLLAALAWYGVWRQWEPRGLGNGGDGGMTFALVLFTIVGLFIAQSLITAADSERRYIASYSGYFEAAWKLEIQLLLSALFVGVFWGVLWLGAELFALIGVKFLETLIEKSSFAIPATTLATAAALHVTDVRARLIAGLRTVAHTLLSWLLPLMAVFAVGFVLSLPFTGLQPLWATGSAAAILLAAAAVLVVLINAAFQDGDPIHNRVRVLRYAEFAAAVVLLPLVLIAADALWLRVAQYGWTVDRVATAAIVAIALCYAAGYFAAAALSLRGGPWMAALSRVNIVTAFAVLAVLVAIFSPIADPARLAVNSQVARLTSGAVPATAFDFGYLHNEGGRYGHDALIALADGGSTPDVRRMAKNAASGVTPTPARPAAKALAHNVTVYPKGRSLPAGFLDRDWRAVENAPACLTDADSKCQAMFADLDGDGTEEVILFTGSGSYFYGTVFRKEPQGWTPRVAVTLQCRGMIEALRAANFAVDQASWRDLVVLGMHIRPAMLGYEAPRCPG